MPDNSKVKGIDKKTMLCALLILVQSIIYGIHDPIVKIAYREVSVYLFLFSRYLLATLLLFIIWHNRIIADYKRLSGKSLFVACMSLAVAYIFVNLALGMTEATTVAFLRSLSAVFASVLMLIITKRIPGRRELILWLMLVVGLLCMFQKGSGFYVSLGAVYALIGAFLVALSLVYSAKVVKGQMSPITVSFSQALVSSLLCFIMLLIKGELSTAAFGVCLRGYNLFAVFYAAIGVVVLGYILQNEALKHVSADLVGILQCFYPITTCIAAPIILHEHLSVINIVGSLIVIACVAAECAKGGAKN